MDFSRSKINFGSFQTIFDSGTYEELCQRQSITAESIYGDEFDADPTVSSDVDSPSDGQNSNPESDNNCAKDKRHQFLRQNSVLQYMRDQKSIDDDPVNILQKIVSISDVFSCILLCTPLPLRSTFKITLVLLSIDITFL